LEQRVLSTEETASGPEQPAAWEVGNLNAHENTCENTQAATSGAKGPSLSPLTVRTSTPGSLPGASPPSLPPQAIYVFPDPTSSDHTQNHPQPTPRAVTPSDRFTHSSNLLPSPSPNLLPSPPMSVENGEEPGRDDNKASAKGAFSSGMSDRMLRLAAPKGKPAPRRRSASREVEAQGVYSNQYKVSPPPSASPPERRKTSRSQPMTSTSRLRERTSPSSSVGRERSASEISPPGTTASVVSTPRSRSGSLTPRDGDSRRTRRESSASSRSSWLNPGWTASGLGSGSGSKDFARAESGWRV